jgi:hypothetical protein
MTACLPSALSKFRHAAALKLRTKVAVLPALAAAAALACVSPTLANAATAPAANTAANAPAWSALEVQSPHTTYSHPSAGLFAVTCTGTANCVAGGEYINSAGHEQAMVVSGSRGTWSGARAIALPHTSYAKSGQGLINGLTCTSAGNCVAVGYLGTQMGAAGDGRGFIDTEVRDTWRKALVPAEPTGASTKPYGEFNSVACSGPGACATVGFYLNAAHGAVPAAQTEVGGRWQAAAGITLPANATTGGAAFAILSSVQCPQSGFCFAVGSYRTTANQIQAMRVTQTRGHWGQAVEVGAPANAAVSPAAALASISCAMPTTCVAVGSYATKGGDTASMITTMAGGQWSATSGIPSVPSNAAANSQPALFGISCQPKFCQALGGYISTSGSRLWMVIGEAGGHWGNAQQITPPLNAATGAAQQGYPYAVSCTARAWCSAVGTYIPINAQAEPLAATRV